MRRAVAWLFLCLAVSEAIGTSAPASNSSVTIECCALWATLNAYVRTHSGIDRSRCEPSSCVGTGQIQLFLDETNAVLARDIRVVGTSLVVPMASAPEMQDVLVWSFLGRHFTSTQQDKQRDDFFFEFNIATRTMALRKIQCEFQKPVYVAMIVLTIIVLLFIIASRILVKSLPAPAAAPAAAPVGLAPAPVPVQLRFRNMGYTTLGHQTPHA